VFHGLQCGIVIDALMELGIILLPGA